jgi:hypothetical protein
MLLRSSLLALSVASGLLAQGYYGSRHGGNSDVPQAQRPTPPIPIGLQHQAAGFTGINSGVYGHNSTVRPMGSNEAIISRGNRTIRRADHDRGDRRRSSYGLPYYPIIGYGDALYDPAAYVTLSDSSAEQTAQVTANLLGEKIQNLTAEVQALREEQRHLQQAPMMQPELASPEASIPTKPMVLVLHSGKRVEVQNYAIMNGVLWDFNSPNAGRIPLESIDGPASEKATEAAGGSFPEASFAKNPS